MKGPRRYKRWLFNPLWLIVGIAAIIIACGSDATTTPRPVATTAPAATATPAAAATPTTRAPAARPVDPTATPRARVAPTATTPPQTAKITRVSMANPPPLTENNRIWSAAWSILLQHDPYGETLIENDEVTSEPIPALAKSWEVSNGFKTWTFELEEGVPWHFGFGEFTSADVAHTWALHTREDALGNFKSLWESGEPTIIDDYNIEFNFDPAMVDGTRLFSRLAGDFVIQSKAQWDAADGSDTAYDDKPAGTGSYQYGGRELGQSIWYEKAAGDHWAGENPDFQELEWIWAAEQFTRLSLLLAGEVQGSDLSRDVYQDAFSRGMKVVSSNNENNQSFGFFGGNWLSTDNEFFQAELPWNDVLVREAMNRAIDRDAILDAIFTGQATKVIVPAYAPFTEGWNDRWEDEFEANYGYDPDRAIELLAEAGYGPGDISIGLMSTVIPGNAEIPLLIETLATMWEAVGINTSIQDLELGTWLNLWIGHDTHNAFSITRNTPIRTTQEALRIFFASDPDGFFHGFEHDFINEQFICLRESVDAAIREDCARKGGDFIFDNYASAPMFQITFDMMIDPEFISEWQYPGVGSAHPTHVHNIRACPVGTDRCE
jgi:peptide/nickel transport system substrate-binding protein